jgi:phytoene dehydrogenase-like protein
VDDRRRDQRPERLPPRRDVQLSRRALVIGSGPNGLAAAITMARAGWDVEVREAAPTIGGGARTEELTLPGFRHDVCSAIHPMGRASPFLSTVLADLPWVEPPIELAHPFDGGSAAVLRRSLAATASGLGRDAAAYRALIGALVRRWPEAERLVLGPFPPVRALVRGLPVLRHAPRALGAARAVAASAFETERARALFAGAAAHSVLPLERRPSAAFGLALCVLAHVAGWGFPRGGAQAIADGLAAELRRLGGVVLAGEEVEELPADGVVLADVVPRELLRLARGRLPARDERALRRYRHGPGAFKVDWALAGPIPWQAAECCETATVHLGGTLAEIAESERAPWEGREAERPFVILAQHTPFDSSRAPPGAHTAWAYCHVPNGSTADMTERIEAQVERFAPGFRDLILARTAAPPAEVERRNRNLVGGDVNGGAATPAQVVLRPWPRLVPYRTGLPGVYLCSAATPPGGGVHGMCGYAAARVALQDARSRPRSPRSG